MPLATMPLLMLDIDNTLVDRDAAFREAGRAFLAEHGLPAADLPWLVALDGDGYTPRHDVARGMAERYGGTVDEPAVRALLDRGVAERAVLPDGTRAALLRAVDSGLTCVIVTNGRVTQQEVKIRNTGLDRLVHGWVVSEAVGHVKPAPEIFHAAARVTGASLDGAWVIGDAAHADIRGAVAVGARSVWVSRGRTWTEPAYRPCHVAPDTAAAIDHVVAARQGY
jgi:putative hydrolase of the HAD superfamily